MVSLGFPFKACAAACQQKAYLFILRMPSEALNL